MDGTGGVGVKIVSVARSGGVGGLVAGWLAWMGDGDMVLGRGRKIIIVVPNIDVDIISRESADPKHKLVASEGVDIEHHDFHIAEDAHDFLDCVGKGARADRAPIIYCNLLGGGPAEKIHLYQVISAVPWCPLVASMTSLTSFKKLSTTIEDHEIFNLGQF